MGSLAHVLERNQWKTIEYYLKLDNKKESEGGSARVRVWFGGELIGDTGERRRLNTPESYISCLYLFTWYGNEKAPKTQSLYMDDIFITNEKPSNVDSYGNPFIGM